MLTSAVIAAAFLPAAVLGYTEHMITPEEWELGRRCHPNETHELLFAVQQRNLDILELTLMNVSTPGSPHYRHYLSYDEVHGMTANPSATQRIVEFFERIGASLTRSTPHGEYLRARADMSVWETALDARFHTFTHRETRRRVRRTRTYRLPSELEGYVYFIGFTTQLPPSASVGIRMPVNASTDSSTTPSLINAHYHVTSNIGSSKASQAVFESLGQYYSPSDLAAFETLYGLPAEKINTDIGGHASDAPCKTSINSCGEANLDVQYMLAVSQQTPTTFWYINNELQPFLTWIEAVAGTSGPPLVHSISYGSIETSVAQTTLTTFNTEAQKLGIQGVSIFVSSGDDGVANFQARTDASKCGFNPSFPASSPYVTAVGATQGPETGSTEIACQSNQNGLITTGGGFSSFYPTPVYQSQAVSNYFATAQTPQGTGYNKGGRGYPDLAMLGHNYEVEIGGNLIAVSGTSASAPVTAAFFSLVNAKRLEAGKAPVGFINPTLYSNGVGTDVCNDVTSGENNCCAGQPGQYICCDFGFYAASGWDPLTGFGSVDFTKLGQAFLPL